MNKIKVGDKVRMLPNTVFSSCCEGKIGTILRVHNHGFTTQYDIGNIEGHDNPEIVQHTHDVECVELVDAKVEIPDDYHDVPNLGSPLQTSHFTESEAKDHATAIGKLFDRPHKPENSPENDLDAETLTIVLPKGAKRLEGEFGGYYVTLEKKV